MWAFTGELIMKWILKIMKIVLCLKLLKLQIKKLWKNFHFIAVSKWLEEKQKKFCFKNKNILSYR